MTGHQLPPHWTTVELASLRAEGDHTFVGGPFGSDLTQRDYVAEPGVPVIRGTNLGGSQSHFVDDGFVYVTERKAETLSRNMAFPGDLVFTQRGTLGQVAVVPKKARFRRYVISQSQMKLTADPTKADSGFLYHYFRTPQTLNRLLSRTQATGVPHINLGILRRFPVALPPLAEQRRIAAVLDRVETLRAWRRAALAQLDSLAESIFLDMFTRDLDGPAVDLSTGRLGLRKDWAWEFLTDAARLATGHTPDRERKDYWNGDIPWISLTDIRDLDGTVATETTQSVTPLGIENSSSVLLPSGTVCFSRTASVGFVTVMGREMATSQDFVNWICGPRLDPTYLMYALIAARRRLRALSSGSTHKTIYVRVVEQFRVLIPPMELQLTFARRIAGVERLKTAQRASITKLDDLFVSLQHRAFSGQM